MHFKRYGDPRIIKTNPKDISNGVPTDNSASSAIANASPKDNSASSAVANGVLKDNSATVDVANTNGGPKRDSATGALAIANPKDNSASSALAKGVTKGDSATGAVTNQKNNSKSLPVTNTNANTNSKNETKDDKKDIPIPNALTITINTSVPGYQTIKYKPYMTLPDIDKELTTIWVDPLIPLSQDVINKVPEDIKVLEFFNKGLFRSLINAHGNQKPMTLEKAKSNKIIDNNIQITLNTLFPTNGILYIKGEAYAIADFQWKKGDWKIDRKIKIVPEIDSSRISDPRTYSNIIKREIQTGNEQLAKLPVAVLYGATFDITSEEPSSSIDTSNIKKKAEEDAKLKAKSEADAEAKKKQLAIENAKPKPKPVPLAIENAKPIPTPTPVPLAIENAKPTPTPTPLAIENASPTPAPLAIENANPTPTPTPLDVEESAVEEIQNIQMSENYKPILKTSKSTNLLRSFFGNQKFYSMISIIFKYMTDEQKIFIQNIFKNTTNIDVKGSINNISIAAYNFTITGDKNVSSNGVVIKKSYTDGLRVISNAGGGNCLFVAVADAINYYNYYSNIDEKILYNVYGNGDMIFTTQILRNIISSELVKLFNSNEELKNAFLDEARTNRDNLNDIHERAIRDAHVSIGPNLSESYYNTTMMDIYVSHDNFFVIPEPNTSNPDRPFKIIETPEEIITYIESPNYWADAKTIDILNKKLKLNIIVIKNTDDKLSIPYPGIKSTDNNTWNKYLFLYNEENHYELITFDYLIKVSTKFVRVKKTIFNRGDNIIPPFYIIFLLFSTFYIKLLPAEKDDVVLFLNFLYAIQNSFNNIKGTPLDSDINIAIFNKNFQNYFGNFIQEIRGGDNVNNATGSAKFLKKEENQDDIQISFHITIDMELQKGKTLSKEQISNIKCIKGWNNVRKSYADFTGEKYVLPPVYENLSDKHNKKEEPNKNNTKKNIGGRKLRRKTRKNIFKI
jgi:hypothetical protein